MRNLNLDQVQTLVAIADLGTFAAAAQALHLSPPAISLHIKELEARMDTALLLRGRRQAVLTAAGELLVAHGRKLLDASDELIDLVQRRASGREGLVKVGVSAGVSTRLLPMMLEQLSSRSPGVEVKLEAVGSADAMQRLRAGSLDVAIVASPQPSSAEIVLTPWRNDPMVVLLPAAWKAPKRVTPDWLADKRWA
ncbi:MAG: LysR family transcriptional regulator, partial [Comamonas sp.]|nr:LysR family transcriptional regulator [Comamonas sp.]